MTPVNKPSRFPDIKEREHAVLVCERTTGNVFSKKFARATSNDEIYHVLDSLASARQFAARTLEEHPEAECCIFDATGQRVDYLVASDERWGEALRAGRGPRPWWRRLLGFFSGGESGAAR